MDNTGSTINREYLTASARRTWMSSRICQHCQQPIAIRNPSGYCDHLYYPDACAVCSKPNYDDPVCDDCGLMHDDDPIHCPARPE